LRRSIIWLIGIKPELPRFVMPVSGKGGQGNLFFADKINRNHSRKGQAIVVKIKIRIGHISDNGIKSICPFLPRSTNKHLWKFYIVIGGSNITQFHIFKYFIVKNQGALIFHCFRFSGLRNGYCRKSFLCQCDT